MKLLRKIVEIETLVIILTNLLIILAFLKLEFNNEKVFEINTTLMTVVGIFSAIILSFSLTRINRLIDERIPIKRELNLLSEKLTNFRRFLYYIVNSQQLWGENDATYFIQLKDKYPLIDNNTSVNKRYGKASVDNLITHERFEYRKTRLFLSMLTIIDTPRYLDMHLLAPASRYRYNLKKLELYGEPCNNLWYYISHRRANGIRQNTPIVGPIYRDSMKEIYEKLIGEPATDNDLNIDLISNQGTKFHSEIIPEMYKKIEFLSQSLPYKFKVIIFELLLLLMTGVIFPLMIISTGLIKNILFTKISLFSSLIVLSVFIITFLKHLSEDIKIY